jgi:hypothetical protein
VAASDNLSASQFHEATSITPPSKYKQVKAQVYKAAIIAAPLMAKAAVNVPHAHSLMPH